MKIPEQEEEETVFFLFLFLFRIYQILFDTPRRISSYVQSFK